MVRCFIEGDNKTWDKHLPLLAMALHATVHRQTGFTPNMLMLGREVNQPADVMLGVASILKDTGGTSEWVAKIIAIMEKAHNLARTHLQEAQMRQKRDYDLKANEKCFNVGDVVLKRDSSAKIGVSTKLRPPFVGPFLVTREQHPVYTIKGKKKESNVHHDRLKLCTDGSFPLWLQRARHTLDDLDRSAAVIPITGNSQDDADPEEEDPPDTITEGIIDEGESASNSSDEEALDASQNLASIGVGGPPGSSGSHYSSDDETPDLSLDPADIGKEGAVTSNATVTRAGRSVRPNPKYADYLP